MSIAVVLDTNVAVVANGKHEAANTQCIGACVTVLMQTRNQVVLVDTGYRIFDEYRRQLSHKGQPGLGDAFFKWLWENQANPDRCRQVPITPHAGSDAGFEEFPNDARLAGFDPSDRKFVAVALGSGVDPDIVNASDTDWWEYREALRDHGVRVRFLCPELMNKQEC